MMPEVKIKSYISPSYQFVNMALSFMILIFSMFYGIQNDVITDAQPEFYPLTPQKISEFGGNPGIVKVGLSIKDFPEFDMNKDSFIFAGQVSFEFDPSLISLETLGKFYFEKGEILYLSAPTTKLLQGKLFVKYDIRVRFTTNLDYEYFPLDNHKLYLIFSNLSLSPNEVIFESSYNRFIISDKILISGWIQPIRNVVSGYNVSSLDKADSTKNIYTPLLLFSMEYQRLTTRNAVTIFLPLLLLYYISLFCFSLDPEKHLRTIMSLNGANIAALLSYRFVIESLSPKVGYFMLSDYIFFLFLGCSCLTFVLATIFMYHGELTKKILCSFLHLLLISGIVYLMFVWMD